VYQLVEKMCREKRINNKPAIEVIKMEYLIFFISSH